MADISNLTFLGAAETPDAIRIAQINLEALQCQCMAQQFQAGGVFLVGAGIFLIGLVAFWREIKKEGVKNVVHTRKEG